MSCNGNQHVRVLFLTILLMGSILGALCLISSVMLFDSSIYSFEKFKISVLVGPFFFYLVVADIIFYIIYIRYGHPKQTFFVFSLPFILEIIVYFWLIYGPIPSSLLPQNDYRYFYDTQAYELVSAIEHQKSLDPIEPIGLNYQDTATGMTPLLFCIRNRYYDYAITLLKKGADPNICCSQTNYSPLLELCCEINGDTTVSIIKNQLIKYLIDYGADINCIVSSRTPLIGLCASSNSELWIYQYMLEHGADLNIKLVQEDEYLHTSYAENEMALNMALYREKYEIVALFLENSPDTTSYSSWLIDTIYRKKRNHKCFSDQEKKAFELLESYFLSAPKQPY